VRLRSCSDVVTFCPLRVHRDPFRLKELVRLLDHPVSNPLANGLASPARYRRALSLREWLERLIETGSVEG